MPPIYDVIAPIKHGGKVKRDGQVELAEHVGEGLVTSGFLVLAVVLDTPNIPVSAPADAPEKVLDPKADSSAAASPAPGSEPAVKRQPKAPAKKPKPKAKPAADKNK